MEQEALAVDPGAQKAGSEEASTAAPVEDQKPEFADMPSVGSQLHSAGTCKPCAFLYTKGCSNGKDCQFCHLCDAGEKKRRRKEKHRSGLRGAEPHSAAGVVPPACQLPWPKVELAAHIEAADQHAMLSTTAPPPPYMAQPVPPPPQMFPPTYGMEVMQLPYPYDPVSAAAASLAASAAPWWSLPPYLWHSPPPQPPGPQPMSAATLESKLKAELALVQQEAWAKEVQRKYLESKQAQDRNSGGASSPASPEMTSGGERHDKGDSPTAFERLVKLVAGGACKEAHPSGASPQRPPPSHHDATGGLQERSLRLSGEQGGLKHSNRARAGRGMAVSTTPPPQKAEEGGRPRGGAGATPAKSSTRQRRGGKVVGGAAPLAGGPQAKRDKIARGSENCPPQVWEAAWNEASWSIGGSRRRHSGRGAWVK
mmetsp:Transcript_43165/g.124791  ORF Transcript_43165/g.124791 Transcript_43165/m.124791 type:complete len:425 (+) Transcript_43165:65-1339(+)